MYREVASLETLRLDGVPRLVETNARHYEDTDFRLYLVTEFVEGPTLRELSSPVSWERAFGFAIQLCRILEACHSAEVVHRDIKPENCIVTLEDRLYLVDFGLAFRSDLDSAFETPIAQEIGNRFLRLPEHRADSANKVDPRTDLTSCVAILYYLLTDLDPRVLVDESERYPHQREPASALIRAAGAPRVDRLLAVFDQAFRQSLDSRFQSADALRAVLLSCNEPVTSEGEANQIAARILERTSNPLYVSRRSTMAKLSTIESQIYTLTDQIIGSLGGAFTMVSSSNQRIASTATSIYRLGFIYSQNTQLMFIPTYTIQHVGSEIILRAIVQEANGDREEFSGRVPADPGSLDASTLDRLRTYLLGKLDRLMLE